LAVDRSEHVRAVERWREARLRRLLAPTGWLAVVDRLELVEGDNELPFGTVTLHGGEAHLRVAGGHRVTVGGEPVNERTLRWEERGPTASFTHAGRIYELVRRDEAFALRVKDPLSPGRLGFAGLSHFPIDLGHRVVARFERQPAPRHTGGVAHFTLGGRSLALEGTLETGSQRLFFTFADETNRSESYPAGRFLYAEVPKGDEVVLDFNTSFNPPCAFTEFVACPVVPAESRLPVAVAAGEKRYAQGH
jgi:uncharacterized protein (DUF1684 family)